MKYCNHCGNKLDENQKFCGKCGNKLITTSTEIKSAEETKVKPSDESQITKAKKNFKLKKLHIIITSVILSLLLVSGGSIFFLKNLNSPEKIIEKFQEAIVSKDTKKLSKIITCTNNKLEINEENIGSLLTLFDVDPTLMTEVISTLNNQIFELKTIGTSKNEPSDFLKLAVKNKNFIYTSYSVEVLPIYLTVNGPSKNISIALNDKEVHKSTSDDFSDKIGPLMPGKYKIKSSFKSGNNIADYAEDLLLNNPSSDYTINALPGYTLVTIECNYNEANIFVNGIDTEIKVKDFKTLGPVKEFSEVYASFTNDQGTFNSNKTTVSSYSNELELNFDTKSFNTSGVATTNKPDANTIEAEVKILLDNYLLNFPKAVNTGDFNKISEFLYPESPLYNSQKNLISTLYKDNIKEEFVSSSYKDFKLDSSNTTGTIVVDEIFKVGKSTSEPKTESYTWTYTFKYNAVKKSFQLYELK